MDKMPGDDATDEQKRQALAVYRKIAVLRSVPCCGMCGTMRHATKPFWCLGMRLCRHCVQANLISSLALYERCWVTFARPIQSHGSFVDAVCTNVFYFSTRLTPNQRLEFSCDRIDFPGGLRTMWFFWKPHLAEVFNMQDSFKEIVKSAFQATTYMQSMKSKSRAGLTQTQSNVANQLQSEVGLSRSEAEDVAASIATIRPDKVQKFNRIVAQTAAANDPSNLAKAAE